ncbi:hypothetical protein QTP86_034585, partial [Hemibagrus guttatus]
MASEYYHYRQAWIPLRWLPSESVFEDDFSTKTDVWSFGVFMWEVFSFGELPYADLADDKVLEDLQEGKLKLSPPHGCPSRIYKLMLRCWASSPKDRVSFSDVVTAFVGKMGKCKDLSEFDKDQIMMARRLDQSISKTAALVGCSRSAV